MAVTHSIVRRYLEANGIRFHIAEAGRPGNPLVLLLHGFPECWYSWRHQLRALAAAGLHAVAPDLRGYDLTEKPALGYDLDDLAGDVVEIARALGYERFSLVGHDWGGLIGWWAAVSRPGAIDRLALLNVAPPPALRRDLARPDQALKSWYALLFQLPLLPEWGFRRNNFEPLLQSFRNAAIQQQAFAKRDLDVFREAIAQPGALHSAINYFRAAFPRFRRGDLLTDRQAACPTLLLWGIADPFAGVHLTAGLEPWLADFEVRYLAACGHWTQQEQPDRVNRALIEFLAE